MSTEIAKHLRAIADLIERDTQLAEPLADPDLVVSGETFAEAFEILIGHEGGYVWDVRDPGGETKYGISKRAYPNEDIKNLTLERAKEIYRSDYWTAIRADELPAALRLHIFDAAVNSGVGRAVMWLQQCVGVAQDGKIGPVTLAAVQARNGWKLAMQYNGVRLRFMAGLTTWQTFGRGWARRIASNLEAA